MLIPRCALRFSGDFVATYEMPGCSYSELVVLIVDEDYRGMTKVVAAGF